MDEEIFPRGGVQRKGGKKRQKVEKDLFKDATEKPSKSQVNGTKKRQHSGEEPVTHTPSKLPKSDVLFTKKQKNRKVDKTQKREGKEKGGTKAGEVKGQQGFKAEELSLKHVCQSMLVLGYVRKVKEYTVDMALPNGRSGEVPITNISDAYLKCLQDSVQSAADDEDETQNVHSLDDMFKVGTLFPCIVMPKDNPSQSIQLSINPRLINKNLSIESLLDSVVFYGSVQSIEDHGYIIDTGVAERRGMLKNTNAAGYIETCNDGKKLYVGQVLRCRIQPQKSSNKSLKDLKYLPVTADPSELSEVKRSTDISQTDLTPGLKVQGKIIEVGDRGVTVSFMKQKGLIHQSHLPEKLSSYSIGQQIVCSVLYIVPEYQSVTLTALPHIVNYAGEPVHLHGFGSLYVGRIVRDARVSHVKASKGVFVKLEGNISGLADMDNTEEDVEYKKGSCHRCIVTGIDYDENKAKISFREDVIGQFINRAEGFIGEVVSCQVEGVDGKKVMLNVMNRCNGTLTKMHQEPNFEYHPGLKLKCKVLSVNEKGVMCLTHKSWALASTYSPVTEVDQVQVGEAVEGFVSTVKQKGNIMVTFYGQLVGSVPQKWRDESVDLKHGDQAVCRVLFTRGNALVLGLEENYEEKAVVPDTIRLVFRYRANNLKSIQDQTSTWIHFDADKWMMCGSKKNRKEAKKQLYDVISQLEGWNKDKPPGDGKESTPKSGKKGSTSESSEASVSKEVMTISTKDCGKVIGSGGSVIQSIRKQSDAKVILNKNEEDVNSTITITGSKKSIKKAKTLIDNCLEKTQSAEMSIPGNCVDTILGPMGATISMISAKSGAKVDLERNRNTVENSHVIITGTKKPIAIAKKLIKECLEGSLRLEANSDTEGSDGEETETPAKSSSAKAVYMRKILKSETISIPTKDCGKVIGLGGSVINALREESEAKIILTKNNKDVNSTISITGTPKSITKAKTLIDKCL